MNQPPERGGDGKTMKIKTERTNQSLFPADYWKAWIEGQEEEGPYGSGKCEAEAIEDLMYQIEDNVESKDDVKTPPPLTPKDSLSVEVELEAIRNRAEPISAHGYYNDRYLDTKRLIAIVEDLQAQLRRKDEALEFAQWALRSDDEDDHHAALLRISAALADGKEGGE